MSVPVGVGSLAAGCDREANVRAAAHLIRKAKTQGAALTLLPEYALGFDPRGSFPDLAITPDDPALSQLAAVAGECGMHVVLGAALREPGRARPVSAVIHLSPAGESQVIYRKVHLFKGFGADETTWLEAGDPAEPPHLVRVRDVSFGVMACYDLRFPEVARVLADAGAHVLLVPAAWAHGPGKAEQYAALVRARAIENTCYAAAAPMAGAGVCGDMLVIGPDGVTLAAGAARSDGLPRLLLAQVSAHAVRETRELNPSLAARRYRVEPR